MENNSNNRNRKNSGGKGLLIVGVITVLSILFDVLEDTTGGNGTVFAVLGVAIAVFALVYSARKRSAGKDKKPDAAQQAARPAASQPVRSAAPQPSKVLTQRAQKREFAECNDEHYVPITDEKKRRRKMLDNMLKSGLIDREEYALMKSRWDV